MGDPEVIQTWIVCQVLVPRDGLLFRVVTDANLDASRHELGLGPKFSRRDP